MTIKILSTFGVFLIYVFAGPGSHAADVPVDLHVQANAEYDTSTTKAENPVANQAWEIVEIDLKKQTQ